MLTSDQIAFFARNGFLLLSGLAKAEQQATIIEWTNERFPPGWIPDNPSSWRGGATDACHDADLAIRKGRMLYRLIDRIGHPCLDALFGPKSAIARAAGSLVGAPLELKLRGLYPIFPVDETVQYDPFIEGHVEAHPSLVITVTYASDAPEGGGALWVWPGSHRAIYPSMESRLDHVRGRGHVAVFREWTARQPVALDGRAGDVILMHHRLVHAPSINRGTAIRYASLCDYRPADYHRLCLLPPAEDMWQDWPAIAALPPELRDAPSDWTLPTQRAPYPDRIRDDMRLRPNPDPSRAVTKRKGDASVLERMRVPGDYWLGMSDVESASRDPKLYPRGGALGEAGAKIFIHDRHRPSVSQYDYFVRLGEDERRLRVSVRGLDRPAWLRLIDTRLPLDRSTVRSAISLDPGCHEMDVDVEKGTIFAVQKQCPECLSNIPVAARECRYCASEQPGQSVAAPDPVPTPMQEPQSPSASPTSSPDPLLVGIGFVAALVVFAVVMPHLS